MGLNNGIQATEERKPMGNLLGTYKTQGSRSWGRLFGFSLTIVIVLWYSWSNGVLPLRLPATLSANSVAPFIPLLGVGLYVIAMVWSSARLVLLNPQLEVYELGIQRKDRR